MISLARLRITLAVFAISPTLASVSNAEDQASADSASDFRFEEINNKSLGLWEGDQAVFVYNHGEMTLPGVRRAQPRSSYLHPIYGLDGQVLTDDFPADHYHHHGLFWGWPHVKIGDREYDLWIGRGIRIDFQRWLAKETDGDAAKLGVENVWVADDRPVMREQVWFRVHPATDKGRNIDMELTWTPIGEAITLSGAEGKSYGGLTLRFAPNSNTAITTPNGRATEDLLITKLPWADYSGRFKGATEPSGAALFVHPQHPDFPPEWMTRQYGVLAVGWPGVTPKTFPAGEPFTCRYRVWIHRGAPDAAVIQSIYDAYRNAK